MTDYSDLKKNIKLQDGLKADGFFAKPLTREDLESDLAGVNSSIETIQKTRGDSWPTEQFKKYFNYLDLASNDQESRYDISFAYVINSNKEIPS